MGQYKIVPIQELWVHKNLVKRLGIIRGNIFDGTNNCNPMACIYNKQTNRFSVAESIL